MGGVSWSHLCSFWILAVRGEGFFSESVEYLARTSVQEMLPFSCVYSEYRRRENFLPRKSRGRQGIESGGKVKEALLPKAGKTDLRRALGEDQPTKIFWKNM